MKKIVEFLLVNGWKEEQHSDEYVCFTKDGLVAIDLSKKEIVLIDDTGDFLHLPFNLFALIGALFHYRQITSNYKY